MSVTLVDTSPQVAQAPPTPAELAVARLDAWLETMRGPGGYGGPVAHWWRQSLLYTGPGLDWRYEGIIEGYLALWRRSGDPRWLAKARRAGDDLLAGQSPDGHFAASAFEINPASGGTPHEAACDLALLRLARALGGAGQAGWERYADAAQLNLGAFVVGRLWSAELRAVCDDPAAGAFVPNKACTAAAALLEFATLTAQELWAEAYALPTLERVLAHQVRGGALDGAIAQNSFGGRLVEKYFPLYIARCIPALLAAHAFTGADHWADAALRALAFVARQLAADGSLPTVVYANGSVNRWPAWVAPLGDLLWAADLLRPFGGELDMAAVEARILAGQSPGGGIATGQGFAAQHGGRPGPTPDFRDLLPVAGWCDKAFRALAERCGPGLPTVASLPYATACTVRGREYSLAETPDMLELRRKGLVRYRWEKGRPWAWAAPELWSG